MIFFSLLLVCSILVKNDIIWFRSALKRKFLQNFQKNGKEQKIGAYWKFKFILHWPFFAQKPGYTAVHSEMMKFPSLINLQISVKICYIYETKKRKIWIFKYLWFLCAAEKIILISNMYSMIIKAHQQIAKFTLFNRNRSVTWPKIQNQVIRLNILYKGHCSHASC